MGFDELRDEALKLSPEARAQLAHTLLLSLDDLPEAEIQRLWLDEAIRRDEEIDAGKVELRPAHSVTRSGLLHTPKSER